MEFEKEKAATGFAAWLRLLIDPWKDEREQKTDA